VTCLTCLIMVKPSQWPNAPGAPNCSTKAGPCACPSPENWDGNFIPPRQMWPHCWGDPVGVRRDVGEKAAKPMRQEWIAKISNRIKLWTLSTRGAFHRFRLHNGWGRRVAETAQQTYAATQPAPASRNKALLLFVMAISHVEIPKSPSSKSRYPLHSSLC
jgi:hypothetical protein